MVVKVYDCEWTSVAKPRAHPAKTQQRAVVSLFRVSILNHSVSVGPAQAHDSSVQQFSLWPLRSTPGEGTRPTRPTEPPSCRPGALTRRPHLVHIENC